MNKLLKITKPIDSNSAFSFLPPNTVVKYPVFKEALILRIKHLQFIYTLPNQLLIYNLSQHKKKVQIELANKGGGYVL